MARRAMLSPSLKQFTLTHVRAGNTIPALPNRVLLKWLQKYIYMNWSRDVIGWSHISPVPIFSTPFTGFLFATSAGLAPLRRYGLTLI